MTDNYIKMLGTAKVPVVGKLSRDEIISSVQEINGKKVLKYRINQPPPVFPKDNSFYETLKKRINDKFLQLQNVTKVTDIDYRSPTLFATFNVFFFIRFDYRWICCFNVSS